MRDLFLKTLLKRAKTDDSIILITADLGFKVLDDFAQQLPNQFLNIGIAEQNMIGVATGLALSGRTVFVYSIANFSSLRCLEQIRNDAAYHDANVKIVSIGSGLSYGQLGISHHATEDISIMRSIPSMMVCSPGDDLEVIGCTNQIIDNSGTCYLRLDRESASEDSSKPVEFAPRKVRKLFSGDRVAIISTGGILKVAKQTTAELKMRGITASLFSLHTICPISPEDILAISRTHEFVFTIEEHTVNGGIGGSVAEIAMEDSLKRPLLYRFGLRDGFSSLVGDQDYLRRYYGLDPQTISDKIVNLVNTS